MIKKITVSLFWATILFCTVSFATVAYSLLFPGFRHQLNIGFPFRYYYRFCLDEAQHAGNWLGVMFNFLIGWSLVLIILSLKKKKEHRNFCIVLAVIALPSCMPQQSQSEIKKKFDKINNSIEASSASIQDKNEQLNKDIAAMGATDTTIKLRAEILRRECMGTVKFIDSLNVVIETASQNMSDVSITEKVIVHTGAGVRLYDRLLRLRNRVIACGNDSERKSMLAETCPIMDYRQEYPVANDFANAYFKDMPVAAAMTLLTKFANDCHNALAMGLNELVTHHQER